MIFPRLHWVCRSGDKHTERKLRRMCCRGLCTGFWHGREEVGETQPAPQTHTVPHTQGLRRSARSADGSVDRRQSHSRHVPFLSH